MAQRRRNGRHGVLEELQRRSRERPAGWRGFVRNCHHPLWSEGGGFPLRAIVGVRCQQGGAGVKTIDAQSCCAYGNYKRGR